MKERLINVIKWLLMILGGLFLLQLLVGFCVVMGLVGFANADLDFLNNDKKLKPIEPIIKYVEDYKKVNGKYPETIEGVKLKRGLEYKYEITKDGNCYTVTIKSKKDNIKKQYQYCSLDSEHSTSKSESYVEYSDNN